MARPYGPLIVADDAAPPSPVELAVPVPAMVVMMPAGSIRRTRLLDCSLTKRVP